MICDVGCGARCEVRCEVRGDKVMLYEEERYEKLQCEVEHLTNRLHKVTLLSESMTGYKGFLRPS